MDYEDPRMMCVQPEHEQPSTAPAAAPERHEEESNPVGTALQIADYAHLAGDAAVDGHVAANSVGGMFAEMGEDAAKIWQGEGTAAQTAMKGLTAIAAPLAIGGGVMDTIEGVDAYRRGDHEGGVLKTIEGGLTTGSGVTGLAGLASGVGATAAPVLGAGATGMAIGHYGDEQSKKLGIFHDDQGRAESASDWAGDESAKADNWVTRKTGSGALGTAAGVATWAGTSIAGAGVATGSAIEGGAHAVANGARRLWDWL
jgi:hypothetical protein